ncbi:Hypothetical predicted protein [Mytilus galloprovincialis]|uniref:Rho termination factor N-terminal domain-containing protein n=1 Tax=Mytilus galloprovincialis TaxID=29158 RepID=A0A8B6FQA1_MYTGA|nr:Hypothetical predicted protein [Mytilus galloprovincialis]
MASNSDNMNRYQDFFLENQEDLEDTTPTPIPQRQQQCCDNPNMTQADEHTQMCQNCETQKMKPRFEHQPDGEQKTTCDAPLKRKKGQFCKSKPGNGGCCWRHSKQPRQLEEEEIIPVEGKMVVKETMKTLRQIAKDEGVRGYSRKGKEALVKLIEEKTNRKFTREEVFNRKQLKAMAKNRGLTNYSQLKRDDLANLIEEDIENTPIEDEIKIIDVRKALNGVFGTVIIEPAKPHDVATFLKWAILSALHHEEVDQKNPNRVTQYKKWEDELKFEGIDFPVSLGAIDKFERQNPTINVNVFGFDGCLSHFSRQDILDEHTEYCSQKDAVRIEMPEEGTTIAFHNQTKQMRVPFAIYADFECFTEKINTCQPNPTKSYTKQYQQHRPSGFCYRVKYAHGDYKESTIYCGEDAAGKFVQCIEEEVQAISKICKEKKPMVMNDEDKESFEASKNCHICGGELEGDKVRDHDHLTGKYRGAAHNQCNLDFQLPKHVPIILHNLSGYDAHLFVKEFKGGKINCIPNTDEKYISFSKQLDGGFGNEIHRFMQIHAQLSGKSGEESHPR